VWVARASPWGDERTAASALAATPPCRRPGPFERLVRERIHVPERGSVIGRALLERQVVHMLENVGLFQTVEHEHLAEGYRRAGADTPTRAAD
jgi:hypothetical protein